MLSNKKSIILFSIPSFLFYTVFIIVSTFSTIKYSFTDFSGIGKANFVGMENYKRLLTDEIFIKSCSNTIIILMVSFLLILPISFYLFQSILSIRPMLFSYHNHIVTKRV